MFNFSSAISRSRLPAFGSKFEVRGTRYDEVKAYRSASMVGGVTLVLWETISFNRERKNGVVDRAVYSARGKYIAKCQAQRDTKSVCRRPCRSSSGRVNLATRFYYVLFMKLERAKSHMYINWHSFDNNYIACL